MRSIKLVNKWVGDNYPCYCVAEIGGSFHTFAEAKRLIDSLHDIEVDAIKFQTFEAETITTKKNYFNMKATGKISQYRLFKKTEVDKEIQKQIVDYAANLGIVIFSAPSHMHDLKTISELELPIIKIGSDLACHIPLLKEVSSIGKPIILSTGMCTLDEVKTSVNTIFDSGNKNLILMHCVSNYPAEISELNLRAIVTLKKEFGIPVGFSDHTLGLDSTIASVVLGANIIERHFKDIKNSPNPDDAHALTKKDFSRLICSIRNIEKALGTGEKIPTVSEQKNLQTNRVSIVAIKNIKKGTKITPDVIDIRRPGTGIQPRFFNTVLGKTTKKNIPKDEPLDWSLFE